MLDLESESFLKSVRNEISDKAGTILGYPINSDFDYSELLSFLRYPLNNVGDPYEPCTYRVNTHNVEERIVDFFAKMFRADPHDYWGYVTNGGSESNLYGLYLARELYPKAMVYYPESTHYSVRKNIHLLNAPSIVIRSEENGEIDYDDLANTLRFNRHMPAIILANFGTTMKEAKDDLSKIKNLLSSLAIQDYYIHCDAALSGAYGPFIQPRIPFDISDGADSIAISGHKFLGSPIPCGVVVTKRSYRDKIAKSISYIGSIDTTITGSRNGLSPLILWSAIQKLGLDGLQRQYHACVEVAKYCEDALKRMGVDAWRNPGAITVVFPKASTPIKNKYQLATQGDVTHIICMPQVTRHHINAFVKEYERELCSQGNMSLIH